MSSAKGKLVRLFGGFVLSRGTIASSELVGGFRKLVVATDAAPPRAGSKVQVLLPSDDVRTYTPIASSEPRGFTLLGWTRASGPGARWLADAVTAGGAVGFVGPQRSLELPPGKLVIVGDETTVAVAASFARERGDHVQALIEAESTDGVHAAAVAVGLRAITAIGRDKRADLVAAAAELAAGATVAVTGGSQLVVAVRAALRDRGVRDARTKTYWIPGKAGLD
jgi:ferredoxin-NADP reductase|nr:hypothetical protein [Kofleriaceae bacterium]